MSYLARLPGKRSRSLFAATATALALGMSSGLAHAAAGSTTTSWACWYNGDTRVQCVLKDAADPAVAPSPYANVNLPGVVKALWAQPAQLADKRVFVPLFNEPEDWDRVRLLTEAVVCGRQRAECVVEFSRNYAEAVLLDPSLEDF